MGKSKEYDKAQKHFLEYPDVFADILNVLVYEGEQEIDGKCLLGAPTESIYPGKEGKLRNQFRDVSMYFMRNGRIRVCYMLENQTRLDRKMVLRQAGYQGALYRNQYEKKYADVFPAVSIVLNWSRRRWKSSRRLRDFPGIRSLSVKTKYLVDDIQLHVYDMCFLSKEVRAKFTSDMRIVAEYLADPASLEQMKLPIKHPRALLEMLSVLSKDERYLELAEQLELEEDAEEGGIGMCEILQKYWDGGVAQGIERGIEQGIERGICALILDNIEEGHDKGEIVPKLIKLFGISAEQAEIYFDRFAMQTV